MATAGTSTQDPAGARRVQRRTAGRVVVSVDGSPGGLAAVRAAAEVARERRWDVEILAAWPAGAPVFVRQVPGHVAEARLQAVRAAEEALALVRAALPGSASCEVTVVNQPVADALAERSTGADLVVVPAPRRPREAEDVRGLGDGRAACPVMVVPTDPA